MKSLILKAAILGAVLGSLIAVVVRAQPSVPDDADPALVPVPDVIHAAPELGFTTSAKILSIRDGDTLKVEFRCVADIRLLDCWAPELHGKYKLKGEKARDNLKKFEGKACTVHVPITSDNIGKVTSLGRILGSVNVNGDDLAYMQRKAGHAAKDKDEFAERWPEE